MANITKQQLKTIVNILDTADIDGESRHIIIDAFNRCSQRMNQRAKKAFNVGDRIKFASAKRGYLVGEVMKLNRKTAKVRTLDGELWTVALSLIEQA